MNNQYQLVLQWRGEAQPAFDNLIDLEGALIVGLGGVGDVDGHDMGHDESNIFVFTDRERRLDDGGIWNSRCGLACR